MSFEKLLKVCDVRFCVTVFRQSVPCREPAALALVWYVFCLLVVLVKLSLLAK